jgi:FkbM family methyltransferase
VNTAVHRLVWRRRSRRKQLGFYRQFIGRRDLVFDVGANRGDRTALFLALRARVVAVEPQRACWDLLDQRFARSQGFKLERVAAGAAAGVGELRAADDRNASMLASLSDGWRESVASSGRFAARRWDRIEQVEVVTVDELIAKHGVPRFIKIDVEGYEPEVLAGLTEPVAAVSFEFTPEWATAASACIDRLQHLGGYRFNLSEGNTFELASDRWLDAPALRRLLDEYAGNASVFGDVYARRDST